MGLFLTFPLSSNARPILILDKLAVLVKIGLMCFKFKCYPNVVVLLCFSSINTKLNTDVMKRPESGIYLQIVVVDFTGNITLYCPLGLLTKSHGSN